MRTHLRTACEGVFVDARLLELPAAGQSTWRARALLRCQPAARIFRVAVMADDDLRGELRRLADVDLDSLPIETVRHLLAATSAARARGELRAWREQARPKQLPPDGEWSRLFLRGGRGSGKSWASTHIFAELIDDDPLRETEGPGEWAIVAPTFGDGVRKNVEGESGLLRALGTSRAEVDAGQSARVWRWNRSTGELVLRDGAVVYVDGADDGALRIQGYNLRGALADEVGLWKRWATSWDESLAYALRKGDSRLVACGTPKADQPARELVRRLLNDPNVVKRRLRTEDNRHNLSEAFWREVTRTAGSRLARQELEGELLEDVEGALWRMSDIERFRLRPDQRPYAWQRRVVALDPSSGSETGAEQGIAVCGLGGDWELYLIESHGLRCSPRELCMEAIRISERHDRATILVEANYGDVPLEQLLESAMREVGRRVPWRSIKASRSKIARAVPVAALMEQDRGGVHHLGVFPELEESMTTYTGRGPSPDRLDAYVHGITELMGSASAGPSDPDASRAVPWSDKPVQNGAVPWGGDDGGWPTFDAPNSTRRVIEVPPRSAPSGPAWWER